MIELKGLNTQGIVILHPDGFFPTEFFGFIQMRAI